MDNDPCKFVLLSRGSSERFTLQAANVDIKQVWVQHIQELLDAQSNFLSGEETLKIFVFSRILLCFHVCESTLQVFCYFLLNFKDATFNF